ncbi:phosphatidylinositol mannoside acyltransferase [Crossiella sp. SN42]|uniref:phosphatidylinositol mannoside acyltransferase n=1 Tax=Crossiella sp. SN42 TaxID=2944808 RepID=UPI00207C1733|nr:phosphatidylinositol mannoside acyltransferase [Crossiella sp. SN42]MCO1578712.1 phosphatidylinositol mannoside acyltransferase [Crossiella sp. SN42]
MTAVRDRLIDTGYAAGWLLTRALPEPLALRLFTAIALRAEHRATGKGLRRNLARLVTPDHLDDTVRAALRSYARYWAETFRLPAQDPAALRHRIHVTGVEHLDAARAAGRGVLLALTHSGNWDVAGLWLCAHAGRFTTVAERLRPESLYRRFLAYRESLGFEILPLSGSAPPGRTLLKRLRANGIVCLLADRVLTGASVPVTLFGEPARLPSGPAHLAVITGAALVPAATWFTDDGWGLRFHPALPVTDIAGTTQLLAEAFAADLAAHPADWHMPHPVWTAPR